MNLRYYTTTNMLMSMLMIPLIIIKKSFLHYPLLMTRDDKRRVRSWFAAGIYEPTNNRAT